MLSRTLLDLYSTLPNHEGYRRLLHYDRIASAWIPWKLDLFRSGFGHYK